MKNESPPLYQSNSFSPISGHKYLMIFFGILLAAIFISILQDYLDSKRGNYPFFFSESLLFKSFWLLFPPILVTLNHLLQNKTLDTHLRMGLALMTATMVHLLLTSITVWCLSVIFREQSYGVIKVLSFSLSNDLVKIVLVYGIFIYGLKYIINNNLKGEFDNHLSENQTVNDHTKNRKVRKSTQSEVIRSDKYLMVHSGKNNIRINLNDILYLKSATPYVSIKTEVREYLSLTTLKSIINKLDIRFIRIHRSCIVNVDKVISYQSRLNGDYDLTLENGHEIRLSRNYANAFKGRLNSNPQLKA